MVSRVDVVSVLLDCENCYMYRLLFSPEINIAVSTTTRSFMKMYGKIMYISVRLQYIWQVYVHMHTFAIIHISWTNKSPWYVQWKKNSHVSPYNKLKRSFLNIQRHINWYQYQILVYGRWNDIKHFLLYKIYKIKMSYEKDPLSCYPFNHDIEYVVLKMNVRYILS